jgi:hypothetical protein
MPKLFLLGFAVILFTAGVCATQAQSPAVYKFCIVQVRDAGDPLVDQYYGPPGHWYFSAIYNSDADNSQPFLEWAHSRYGRAWTVNHSMPNKGLISFCRSYGSQAEARKALGSPGSDGYQNAQNAYFTHTEWPNVPPNNPKKQ